jgi:hypothetical protein
MHVRSISIPRSTSPHAAAPAQQHRRARLRPHFRLTLFFPFTLAPSLIHESVEDTKLSTRLNKQHSRRQVLHQLDHALLSRIKERMLGPVLAQRCLDLVVLGQVESGFAPLKRAGVSAVRGEGVHACAAHLHPSLYRHSNTDAHDCVHTSDSRGFFHSRQRPP